jgi:2-isopropylmalate synthase
VHNAISPQVTVRVQDEHNGRVFFGRGSDTDIIYASADAYVNAINKIVAARGAPNPTHPQPFVN